MEFNKETGEKIGITGNNIHPMSNRAYNKALNNKSAIVRWIYNRALEALRSIKK